MADKEAHVFIVDLSETMSICNHGRVESDLDWSMRYFWDKISHIVSLNRKGLCVGVIGLRTDETDNDMAEDDEAYHHISVLRPLGGPLDMAGMRALQEKIKPSEEMMGDAISAIALGIKMIQDFTKKLKYKRQITLITDGLGHIDIDEDDISAIADGLNAEHISLTVLGVDFDDAEFGFKEEDKPSLKRKNEGVLKRLVDQCAEGMGNFGTIAEAIDELDIPIIKQPRPYKSFEGTLALGDPKVCPAAMLIQVERYFKTKTAVQMPASTVVVKSESAAGPSQTTSQTLDEDMDGVEFAAVKQARTYKVNDPTAPGGKRDVEFESLARGYEYGRTAVYINESDKDITTLETKKEFTILGFIDQRKYEPLLNMGESNVILAQKYNYRGQVAFSSLVQGLHKAEAYGVARIVPKDRQQPLLVLLAPDIENNCLYDVPLPFAEDVRAYQFPPLDRVVTVSGSTLTQHRLLPSDDLSQAMSDYVDSMDLSGFEQEEDGTLVDYMAVDEPFNPVIHRIKHAVKERAVHPDKPLPGVPSILTKFSVPPENLVEAAQAQIDALIEVAEVKKVPPKAKGKFHKEKVKPISNLDLDSILGPAPGPRTAAVSISPDNAIPEFKRIFESASSPSDLDQHTVRDATKQMGDIVKDFISASFGGNKDDRALEHLGCMRDELLAAGQSGSYNTFIRDLKKRILAGELDGDRRELWWKIRKAKLGLIDEFQAEGSSVTADEAWEFYTSR